jgi:serine/threonine-protein kinase
VATVQETQAAAHSGTAGLFPGYQVLDTVGESYSGQVYRARQCDTARIVAIKLLSPVRTTDSPPPNGAWPRRSALSHPNVVAIYDRGQVNGQAYLVREYIAGAPLRAAMKRGQPWPLARTTALLDKVCDGLAHLHEQGILHLNLKPENVLCAADGTVKVTDFGLALPHVDARTLVERGLVCGPLDYCSPEQRYGLPLDQRSDVFSLATLAYELLTGLLPGRVYRRASVRNPALPAALDPVLERGLARDPQERQGGVVGFRSEFSAATAGMYT